MLSNKVYNVLKWICLTLSPAAMALITGLGLLYGFDSEIIVGTIALVTTFIGSLIGISTVQYNKAQASNFEDNNDNGAK